MRSSSNKRLQVGFSQVQGDFLFQRFPGSLDPDRSRHAADPIRGDPSTGLPVAVPAAARAGHHGAVRGRRRAREVSNHPDEESVDRHRRK